MLTVPASAQAAFPGRNGKIAFAKIPPGPPPAGDIHAIDPDGSGDQPIIAGSDREEYPAWSPAGTRLAFERWTCTSSSCTDTNIWAANADGTGQTQLTDDPSFDFNPAWSPDGTTIVFVSDRAAGAGLYVMNADGSGETRLTTDTTDVVPAWSPDGSRIAFARRTPEGDYGIYVMAASGAGAALLANLANKNDLEPDWSPDGTKLVFSRDINIHMVNADGTGQGPIVTGETNHDPAWSPQGDRIAFWRQSCPPPTSCTPGDLYTVNPDGTGMTQISNTEQDEEFAPSWQPIPINSYIRPAGARAIAAALVPAYRGCDSDQATLSHGPPLAHPSCASPALTSGHLTLGEPTVNGRPANSAGRVRIVQIGEGPPVIPANGDQADVGYELALTDVRRTSDLSDYTGELQARVTLRITDRDNTPSPVPNGAATVTDTTISFDAPCVATASTTIGGRCSVATTADALVPNTVKEAKRAVWALGKVRVLDGGADGDAQTGPNTLFATQGVFIP